MTDDEYGIRRAPTADRHELLDAAKGDIFRAIDRIRVGDAADVCDHRAADVITHVDQPTRLAIQIAQSTPRAGWEGPIARYERQRAPVTPSRACVGRSTGLTSDKLSTVSASRSAFSSRKVDETADPALFFDVLHRFQKDLPVRRAKQDAEAHGH